MHTYVTMLPAVDTTGMRDGSKEVFCADYNILPICKDRMDSRTWVPTPTADVIYSMSRLDPEETSPLVVAARPNVMGMFTGFFQRTLTDVDASGLDRARFGLYLILPPNHDGHVPDGYFTFESSTCNVFVYFCTITAQGDGVSDPVPAEDLAEQTCIYPLCAQEKEISAMEFPDARGQRLNMIHPIDNAFWTKL